MKNKDDKIDAEVDLAGMLSPSDTIDAPLWWHEQGLTQTATGYGAKLTTRRKIRYKGRLRRVYATCFSNVASCWIQVKGEKIYFWDF